MNDSNNQEGVLLTTSGEPQKATEINAFLIITKVLSCFIGIPLNVFVAIIIIRLRRLHSKPRNIFLLGIIFSNLLTFVPALIEVIYWVLPLDIVCQSYVAVGGLPNTLLLWNMLLALIDRYVAIKYPIWHREKVTVRRVIYFLLFSSVFLGFLIKFVFIFGLIQLRCTVWTVHSKVVGLTMAILFVLCVIAHFIVFQQTKTLLQKNRTLCPSTKESIGMQTFSNRKRRFSGEDNNQENVFAEGKINEREGDVDLNAIVSAPPNLTSVVNLSSNMVIHVDNEKLSRMELEAARTLVIGVASLFAMTFAILVLFIILYVCQLNKFECDSVRWLAPYFKELWLIHSVYNPIIWFMRNDEIWLLLKNKIDAISQKRTSTK